MNFSSPVANTLFDFLLCSSFLYKEGRKVRTYSSILGCLIRKYWPGAVKMPNGRWEIAWFWRHYKRAKYPLGTKHEFLVNCQARVLTEFWVSFFDYQPFGNLEVENS